LNQLSNKTILLTTLNWGIGHASRCVPLIHAIQDQGAKLIIGSDGKARTFLQKEFPKLEILEMPTNEIRYGKRGVAAALLPQLPAFFKQIKADQKWIKEIVAEENIDLIISDNRYGSYHESIPSVLITHQLNIQTPKLAKPMIDKVLKSWVDNFNEIWVPDVENGLAGILTSSNLRIPIRFLGPLSRFSNDNILESNNEKDEQLLILLSGPEPQRSILEEKIWMQLSKLNVSIILVRGTNSPLERKEFSNVEVYDLLTAEELSPMLEKATKVVCRSGYSTLMDLAQINCQAYLIPTPGQSEQEYLAKYFSSQYWAQSSSQDKFNINEFLSSNESNVFPNYPTTIDKWIYQINQLTNF